MFSEKSVSCSSLTEPATAHLIITGGVMAARKKAAKKGAKKAAKKSTRRKAAKKAAPRKKAAKRKK